MSTISLTESAIQYLQQNALSAGTAKTHQSILSLLHPKLASSPIDEVGLSALMDERARFLRLGLQDSTISKRLRTVVTWIRFAKKRGHEVDASVFDLKIPRGEFKSRDLDPNIAAKVWESFRAHPDQFLATWLLSYHLGGARIKDVLLLRRENIKGGRVKWTSSKTGYPHDVAYGPELQLLVHRFGGSDGRLSGVSLGSIETDEEMLRAIGSATSRINNELRDRGLGISCHDARRACAAKLLENGVDLDTVRRSCGWRRAVMPLHYSAHVRNDRIDGAMRGL